MKFFARLFSLCACIMAMAMSCVGTDPVEPVASLELSAYDLTLDCDQTKQAVRVTTQSGWTASTDQSWCTVAPSSGSGDGSFIISVSDNESTSDRSSIVTVKATSGGSIATKTVALVQRGREKASLSLSVTFLEFPNTKGEDSIKITSNMDWTASSDQSWCKVTPSAGSGDGTLKVNVEANAASSSREAKVTVTAGEGDNALTRVLAVVQAGEEIFSISKTEFNLTHEAAEIEVEVTSNIGFTYHVENTPWITDATTDAASGKLKFKVAENTSENSRTGIIVICSNTGQCYNVTVKQEGKEAEEIFTISQNEFSLKYAATEIEVEVTSNKGFTYHVENTPWITDATTDALSGKLKFKVEENKSVEDRTGMIVICSNKGQCYNVSVKQEGRPDLGLVDPEEPLWLTQEFYHKSLAMRFTATWCGYCPIMNEAIHLAMAARPDKFEYLALHGSGSDLVFSGTSALMSQYHLSSYPSGVVDGRAAIPNYNASTGAALFTAVHEEREKNYPVVTTAAFASKIDGDNICLDLSVYAKAADNYKVTVMLLEDGIIGYQADNTNGSTYFYHHDAIARASFSSPLGDAAVIADPAKPWKSSYSVKIPDGCNRDNLRILVYIQRPYGSQRQVKGVVNVTYGSYGGYYVDNSLSAPVGDKTQIVYVDGNGETTGITDPIG